MNFNIKSEGDLLRINFSGDLIGETKGPELVELVNNELASGAKICFADISEVRYINSSGIGVLITVLTKFRNKGGELYLIKPSEHVRKLLIMTKLLAIFKVVDSIEEAEANLKN